MVILALKFLSWYRSNRNFVILLYCVSFIITSISIVSSIVFFTVILLDTPAKKTSPSLLELPSEQEEVGHGPEQEEVGHGPEQEEVGHGPEQEEVGHGPEYQKIRTIYSVRESTNRLCYISYCELFITVG